VNRDPTHLALELLALAGVQAGANLEAEVAHRVDDRARAQRIARAGPSKLAKKPSPAVSSSFPWNRASCRRMTA
jgi:hypothetical protein